MKHRFDYYFSTIQCYSDTETDEALMASVLILVQLLIDVYRRHINGDMFGSVQHVYRAEESSGPWIEKGILFFSVRGKGYVPISGVTLDDGLARIYAQPNDLSMNLMSFVTSNGEEFTPEAEIHVRGPHNARLGGDQISQPFVCRLPNGRYLMAYVNGTSLR